MIFARPCLTQSRTPKGQGRCQSTKIGGRDDRSGDAGCTHTDRFKLEGPSAAGCNTLGAEGSISRGTTGGMGDTAYRIRTLAAQCRYLNPELSLTARVSRLHFWGHSCNTRVRCLIVSLMRGRCLIAFSNTAWALPRLFPARASCRPSFRRASISQPCRS
jgi:hypothetical protein